jgi:predicted DNA-binding protein
MPANVALSLPANIKGSLDRVSERTGVPRALIITRLLDQYLYGTDARLPKVTPEDRLPVKPRQRGMGDTRA